MGAVAAPLIAGGGILNAFGTFSTAQDNQRLLEMQSDQLDQQAKFVVEQGDFAAQKIRLDAAKIMGEQKTSYAAQGVSVATGSAAAIQEETEMLSEQDVKQTKLNAAREAWGMREQAKVNRWKGDRTMAQGRLSAIGGLLGTGGSVVGGMK